MRQTLLAFTLVWASAAAQIPDIRNPLPRIDLPGLENLIRKEAALTSSLDDADYGLKFLDGWDPGGWVRLTDADRAGDAWKLKPGHYEMTIQSYCGRAGTPGQWHGYGYVDAPFKGAKATLLRNVVKRADKKPHIDQRDVQLLVWAIIARAKPQDLRGGAQRAAAELLTPQEIADLNGYGLSHLEDRVMDQLMGRFDRAMRPIYQAENNLRGALSDANRPFEEIERLAVLPPVEDGENLITAGRWSWNVEGYAVRYFPNGYREMKVQVVVPQRFKATRDSKGRIVRLEGPFGWSSQVEYDDGVEPVACPTDAGLIAYKFKSVRLISPHGSEEIKDTGWCFVGVPTGRPPLFAGVGTIGQGNWFTRWRERAERAQEYRERYEETQRQAERLDRIMRGDASDEDFLDTGHYQDGIEAATSGDPSERIGWIGEHHARQNEALLHGINVLETLPDGTEVDPGGSVHIPGSRGSQRLLGSSRTR